MIGRLWDRALRDSLVLRRRDNLNFIMREIEDALAGRHRRATTSSTRCSRWARWCAGRRDAWPIHRHADARLTGAIGPPIRSGRKASP